MVKKKNKLKVRVNAYKVNKGISYSFEHCGVDMIGIPLEQEHFNCEPIKWQCPICGRTINTDTSSYDCPKPAHIGFELEVDMDQGEKKILKKVEKAHLKDMEFD